MKTLFAIPGTMCNQLLWQELTPLFVNKSITFTHTAVPEKNSVSEIISQLADTLPKKPFSLLGFSLGGYLASVFASQYPDRICELTVISNSPCALSDTEQSSRAQMLKWLTSYRYKGITTQKAQAMLENEDSEWVDIIKTMDAQMGVDSLVQQLNATTERNDLLLPMSQLHIPIRFIVSENDALIQQHWLTDLEARNSNVSIQRVPGKSHMIPLEFPELVAQMF